MTSRIIVFVDHEVGWRLLEKIIYLQKAYNFLLVAAVTTEENGKLWWPGVSGLCEKEKIPLLRYHAQFSEILEYAYIDWHFLLSWKYIVPSQLLSRPLRGTINLHYSLLPEYRGVYPVNWAIMEGKKNTGVTYHLVNNIIDDGRIIFQKEEPIRLNDTARTLQLKLDNLAVDMFESVMKWAIHERNGKLIELNSENNANEHYRSRLDFVESNEIDINREYRAMDFLNLLRGKTFRPETRSLYFVDPESGKRIYVSINLTEGEMG